jgi:hypothetical protein
MLFEVEEEERLDPRVLVEPAVPRMPVRFLVSDPHRDRPDEGRKGRRRRDHAAEGCRTGIDVELDGRHGQEELPALANIRRRLHLEPAPLERALQIREEVVVERLRGQGGDGEAPPVVVQRGVDNQARAVAGLLARGDVLKAGLAVEPLSEDLGESPRREGGVDPPERQELAPDQGRLEVLAEIRPISLKEGPVRVGQGPIRV